MARPDPHHIKRKLTAILQAREYSDLGVCSSSLNFSHPYSCHVF
jgi:hypothetical protein